MPSLCLPSLSAQLTAILSASSRDSTHLETQSCYVSAGGSLGETCSRCYSYALAFVVSDMSLTVWHHLTAKQPHHNYANLAILRNKLNDPSRSG